MTCKTCKWFSVTDSKGVRGLCRYWPPQVVADPEAGTATFWPKVKAQEFCSFHREVPSEEG